MRRLEGGIDPSSPWIWTAVIYRRQFKVERVPVGICDQMKDQILLWKRRAECEAARIVAPIRLVDFHAVPSLCRSLKHLVQGLALKLRLQVSQQPSFDEQPEEAMHLRMLLQ